MMNKNRIKPIVIFNDALTNEVLIERIGKSYQIQYSCDLPPFTCFFPLSSTTFLMVDFTRHFQNWFESEHNNVGIISLVNFVNKSNCPYIIFLTPKLELCVVSIVNEIQKCVEQKTNRVLNIGFATSWKEAANYMLDVSKALSFTNLEQEHINHKADLEQLNKSNEEMKESGKLETIQRMNFSKNEASGLIAQYGFPEAVFQAMYLRDCRK